MFNFTLLATTTLLALSVSGCAMVSVGSVSSEDYLSARRGDVLTTGQLSASARTALQVVGTNEGRCNTNISECRKLLIASIGISDEQRLSTISELWLQEALQNEEAQKLEPAKALLDPYAKVGVLTGAGVHATIPEA